MNDRPPYGPPEGMTEAEVEIFNAKVEAEVAKIDPETCEVTAFWRPDGDPYGLHGEAFERDVDLSANRTFVRRPGGLWVRDIALPDDAYERLRLRAEWKTSGLYFPAKA
jgi:hypothetical protein